MDALDLYESFHYIQRQTSWGRFPWGCICLRCCKWTLCEHTALLTSLYRSDVVVPDNLVAATPALRKKRSKIRGTAGPRRAHLIKEIAKQKKSSTSKIGFVNDPVPPVSDAVPDAVPRCRLGTRHRHQQRARGWLCIPPNCHHPRRMRTADASPPLPAAAAPLCSLPLCQSAHHNAVG